MANSVLGGTIGFLAQVGVYDVILPFLLVFSLMFAFLEKTRVLGVEEIEIDGKTKRYSRKNLNSIIAFTAAFFVIASSELVRILSEVIANTMILIVVGVMFMLAIGVTHSGQKEFQLKGIWKKGFWIVNLIGILLIFFNAMGWLQSGYSFLASHWNTTWLMTIISLVIFIGFMAWVTASPKEKQAPTDAEKNFSSSQSKK